MGTTLALKLTVIKKAHGQVIADRIPHLVREMQKYHDIICQKRYQRCQKTVFNTRTQICRTSRLHNEMK